MFDKKSKNPPIPFPTRTFLGIATNVATGPLGFRAELDIGPDDERSDRGSRIVFQNNSSEDEELPAPEASTFGVAVGGTGHGSDPTRENATDTGERDGKSKLAEASKVQEREYENTALTTTTILSIPKGAAHESSPLGPLKAVLRTIAAGYANHQETVGIGNKIEVLLSRIVALEARFHSRPEDVEEQRHRSELIGELGRIEGKLRHLPEKPKPGQPTKHAQDNEKACGFLKDLREAIFSYHMVQRTAIHDRECELIKPAEAAVLNNVCCAQEAEYRHGDRKGCLKRTRGAVLDSIEVWARDFDNPPVYWLNGLAGTGKSTIAQTIAERIFADGQLGASFFCSRDFEDRRNLKFIFPTIAVQLARNYAEFRSIFVPLVRSDPETARESLYNQMDKLVVRPLKKCDISTVIIIDALDECKDEEPASAILSVLGQFVSKIPKVKFFVTGRPEPRIREGFRLPLLAKATDVFILHDVEPSLTEFPGPYSAPTWTGWLAGKGTDGPPCERAAGLFVYAVATIKFIDHKHNNPKEQLECILQSPTSSVHEGRTRFKPDTTLDSLYMSIVREAFGGDGQEDDPKARSVLGAVILAANPLSPSSIAALLGIDSEGVSLRLSSVHSLLVLHEGADSPVRPFHKSFPDFIVDPTRCTDERFHVSPPSHHPELLAGCLVLMNQTLEKNMCNLPDGVANREIKDLHERTKRCLNPALQYACKSWHKHLIDKHTIRTPVITSALHRFLEKKFLFWLEVLSVLGAAREAVDALDVTAKLLQASPTLDLVNDCFRFVIGFFEVIDTSSPHIYHSALPLCPHQSIVRSLYEPHARPLARIVRGLPNSWESNITAVRPHKLITATVWSPCGRFIAVPHKTGPTMVKILDAVTLERITILDYPRNTLVVAGWLAFSLDTRLLTCSTSSEEIITWDLQTGGLVSTIATAQPRRTLYHSTTYSACGAMFATLCQSGSTRTISIYNVLFGTPTYSHSVDGEPLDEIWTHGDCLRFATMESGSITTWEVGFASPHAPTRVESLPIPDGFNPKRAYRFHPTTSRLAFTTEESILVWDAHDSKLLESTDINRRLLPSVSFSHDGRTFACGTKNLAIYLWKESPTGYTLHRKLISNTTVFKPLVSPNGESIIAVGNEAIQLWRITDSITSLSDISTPTFQRGRETFILGLSPDEASVVVTRMKDETVVVLDLNSGIPRLTIDTGMKVYAVGMAGSAVVVVGEGKIVTWNLPAGNDVLNPRANVNDIILTTTFNHPPFSDWQSTPTTSVSPDLRGVVMVEQGTVGAGYHLHIYDVLTGQCLASVEVGFCGHPCFTLDGREVWYTAGLDDGWEIIEDGRSDIIRLKRLPRNQRRGRLTCHPPRGYEVTDGGWVLSPSRKRLLWLPPSWRSDFQDRVWSGRFLVLLGGELPEPVILELEE
ncbi:hypothetical protein BDM02DRAFT_3191288 [Thelephora ganbajun]|uniref:Uncharacterized protein n=1 Tax=Thelephora ganbajun TaxID=370292 RepID=A0ACB6Z242_THEGA|nr:hypothetical protein BDM02DRAFT_3191288 [Thelephora ganbajun]